MVPKLRRKMGFTLIELLIVIAIILILIAIALPNFLEAQIRAKVTQAKSELRSIGIAMDSYFLDWDLYPYESEDDCSNISSRNRCGLSWLTSPVAYMTVIPKDSFNKQAGPEQWYELGVKVPHLSRALYASVTWALWSTGPDGFDSELDSDNAGGGVTWHNPSDGSNDTYSATNGTKSRGDLFIFGGDSFWIGVTNGTAAKPVQGIQPLVVNGVPYVHTMPPSSLVQ